MASLKKQSLFKGHKTSERKEKNSLLVPSQIITRENSTNELVDSFSSFHPAQETDTALMKRIQKRFQFFTRSQRQSLIIALIRQCDPIDMLFLNEKIPKLHRDFLGLLPVDVVHRILGYIHPRDFCNVVQICKNWARIAADMKLWQKLYAKLGLVAMANTYYLPHAPMVVNAKRLYSLGNWSKGRFIFKKFRAHALGILCIAFDSRWIVVILFLA